MMYPTVSGILQSLIIVSQATVIWLLSLSSPMWFWYLFLTAKLANVMSQHSEHLNVRTSWGSNISYVFGTIFLMSSITRWRKHQLQNYCHWPERKIQESIVEASLKICCITKIVEKTRYKWLWVKKLRKVRLTKKRYKEALLPSYSFYSHIFTQVQRCYVIKIFV